MANFKDKPETKALIKLLLQNGISQSQIDNIESIEELDKLLSKTLGAKQAKSTSSSTTTSSKSDFIKFVDDDIIIEATGQNVNKRINEIKEKLSTHYRKTVATAALVRLANMLGEKDVRKIQADSSKYELMLSIMSNQEPMLLISMLLNMLGVKASNDNHFDPRTQKHFYTYDVISDKIVKVNRTPTERDLNNLGVFRTKEDAEKALEVLEPYFEIMDVVQVKWTHAKEKS